MPWCGQIGYKQFLEVLREGLNVAPTETSVSFKGKKLLRAFEKYFNNICIKIILTAIH